MTSTTEFSQSRQLAGQIALALATILLIIVLSQALAALLFSHHVIWWRLAGMFAASVVAVFITARVCLAKSVYWQIPLQSVALAFLLVGVPVLVSALFSDWRGLFGSVGLLAGSCVALGLVAAWLLRRLQARIPDDPEA